MKICIIAGAKGGSAKTTTAVRVAERMSASGVPSGIVDLSPFPTAHLLLSRPDVALIQGAGASTTIAAESILRPHRDAVRFAFIDTGRLDAARLAPWLPLCESVLIASPVDPFSISAMPAMWSALEQIRAVNAQIRFMGILPVLVRPEGEALCQRLRTRFPGQFLDEAIPYDEAEVGRAARAGAGLPPVPGADIAGPAFAAWKSLSVRIMNDHGLAPRVEAAAASDSADRRGFLGKLWRMASGKLGRASVVGKEATA